MGFLSDSEKLRLEGKRQIAAGETTTGKIARAMGVAQSTVSNFLNGRKKLSLANLDRLLDALGLTMAMLEAPAPTRRSSQAETIPLVRHATAISTPVITPEVVIGDSGMTTASVPRAPSRASITRSRWTRYVAVTATAANAEFLGATLRHGSTVVIDRHFQDVVLLRKGHPRVIYAIGGKDVLKFGCLQKTTSDLALKSDSRAIPDEPVTLGPGQSIVGRICKVANDP